MIIKRRPLHKPRIELIPMIDVIFFVLVFFVVASLSMVHQRGLNVDLPRAAAGMRPDATRLTVTVRADGSLYLNKQPIILANLLAALRERVATKPELTVIVNADRRVDHGHVVDVMDAVRLAGARRLTIATTPKAHRSP